MFRKKMLGKLNGGSIITIVLHSYEIYYRDNSSFKRMYFTYLKNMSKM